MGIHADDLTEMMIDMKTLHDLGECDMGCDWCREKYEEEEEEE